MTEVVKVERQAVSTHSRPKAAGSKPDSVTFWMYCFNTQPPEGGWENSWMEVYGAKVSTHSRPKAAGFRITMANLISGVSTHSRPKAAGCHSMDAIHPYHVSTHSRPKAAGADSLDIVFSDAMFQHTAARRRLGAFGSRWHSRSVVSTHSRPKAAGFNRHNIAFHY